MIASTSKQAYRGIQGELPPAQAKVLAVIERHPEGVTNLEIAAELAWPINRVTGRVTELKTSGAIAVVGHRKMNGSRFPSQVWRRVRDVQPDLYA